MSMCFSDLIDSASFVDGVFSLDLPADWMQGRTTYGGMSAALCYEAARRVLPDAPPLRSAMISFIGPAGGRVEGRARILRQGKSVTFAEADLSGEQGLATRAAFAFGAPRQSAVERTFTKVPDLPAPDACEDFLPDGAGPTFAGHFEARLAKGGRPASGSKEHDHFIWVRHRDPRAAGLASLFAIADMPPPAILPMFTEFLPISSMTWMVNLLSEAPATRDGWWLMQSRAEQAGQGYSSQDMLVWNRDGALVIAGRQNVAVFG